MGLCQNETEPSLKGLVTVHSTWVYLSYSGAWKKKIWLNKETHQTMQSSPYSSFFLWISKEVLWVKYSHHFSDFFLTTVNVHITRQRYSMSVCQCFWTMEMSPKMVLLFKTEAFYMEGQNCQAHYSKVYSSWYASFYLSYFDNAIYAINVYLVLTRYRILDYMHYEYPDETENLPLIYLQSSRR